MASEVDISNLMLSRLGDDATVSSLDPPEGSAQAEHCATFYPIARDSLLEMHDWGFATRRKGLTETTLPDNAGWQYAYLLPAQCLRVIAVLPPSPPADYTATLGNIPGYHTYGPGDYTDAGFQTSSYYIPQDFAQETIDDGTQIILTDQPQAIVRYTVRIIDTTKFSPLFIDTLGWYGASMMAGPILKGDVGAAEGKRCLQLAMGMLNKAASSDARGQQIHTFQNVPWIGGRR